MASICEAIASPAIAQYPSEDIKAAQISKWDKDFRRAARARTVGFELPSDFAADLEQEARVAVLNALNRYGDAPEQLIRTIVANSILKGSINEARWRRHTAPVNAAENICSDFEEPNHDVRLLSALIRTLPSSVQQVFQLLYVEGVSQRIAAARMKVSQPRITHLHKELKETLKALLQHRGNGAGAHEK